jgi:LPS export ABC transporter protein LptC
MQTSGWQFFVSRKHQRLSHLWQSFFAGWGLIFTITLAVSTLVFQNISWTILDIIDVGSIKQNNMTMTNLKINGTDKNGEPFSISSEKAFQKFSEQNIIYFESPAAEIVRVKGDQKIHDKITAKKGKLDNLKHRVTLNDSVKVRSSDGSSIETTEMEIDLK